MRSSNQGLNESIGLQIASDLTQDGTIHTGRFNTFCADTIILTITMKKSITALRHKHSG
ncbi:MAG: hypothetical protein WC742_14210 [Gallionellaceae bacterium]